jgi:hypothetical protein
MFVALPFQFRIGPLKFGDHPFLRRGQRPAHTSIWAGVNASTSESYFVIIDPTIERQLWSNHPSAWSD